MRLDAKEEDIVEFLERGEWRRVCGGKQARKSLQPLRQSHVPQGHKKITGAIGCVAERRSAGRTVKKQGTAFAVSNCLRCSFLFRSTGEVYSRHLALPSAHRTISWRPS